MPGRARSRIGLWFLLASSTVGCASGSNLSRVVTLQEGQPTLVFLRQAGGKLTLSLRNESAGYAADVYQKNSDPNLKVVPDIHNL